MKLAKIHITNFRSIEDSGEFNVQQTLCLVGKNEAGKTALLQALAGLNPHPSTPIVFDVERDYPRRHLTEYDDRHKDGQAIVVKTKWTLSPEEKTAITNEFGDGCLTSDEITISRRYKATQPDWSIPLNTKKTFEHLFAEEGLNATERKSLNAPQNTKELRDALLALNSRSLKLESLLARINAYPGQTIAGRIVKILEAGFPRFMYFSHYDRMSGQLRLDTYNPNQPNSESGDRVFVDFLEYAGTSIGEIQAANTYESLNARCEAASNRITQQLQEYWTQNPNLEIEVRVTKGSPNDPPPFHEGIIARARVKNNLHKVTVPFSERSAGFVWFFSFLVKFAQVRKDGSKLILLLDEPGLTLHGKAQADLLRYFAEKLAPEHQLIFSTHSPFMVPTDDLLSVRIVEDRITSPRPGLWQSEGTKVRDDSLATDRDTLFPLQGALGYEITQSLFVGKHTLLVEGPSDILYLQSWSSALQKVGKRGLDSRWTVCPAGSIDKIQPFISLFAGGKLDISVLTDYAKSDRRKHENFHQQKILGDDRFLTYAGLIGIEEADVEDVFSPELYVYIVNQAYNLPPEHQLSLDQVIKTEPNTTRIVKKVEACFRLMPPSTDEFDHFRPAEWLIKNPHVLETTSQAVNESLLKAEKVINAVNDLLGA